MEKLQKLINYEFKNKSLLKLALTHRSAGKNNNERLEFLGDSILGIVISAELYVRFNNIKEGKLSRLRSHLVRGQTLAQLADQLKLAEFIILGRGELKSGAFNNTSIHADAVEAIFGAIFIDSDFEQTRTIILDMYKDLLDSVNPNDSLKDSKSDLQEYLQKYSNALPQYSLVSSTGKDHNAIFLVKCLLSSQNISVEKTAQSIKKAEQLCAQHLLEQIKLKK